MTFQEERNRAMKELTISETEEEEEEEERKEMERLRAEEERCGENPCIFPRHI